MERGSCDTRKCGVCISRVPVCTYVCTCVYIYIFYYYVYTLVFVYVCASLRLWRSQRHEERRKIEGMFARDRDREATAEFAILPTSLIRREIRSSMVEQLASSPDHMKPSTPSSFSFLPGHISPFFSPPHPLPLLPFISSRCSMLFAPFPWAVGRRKGG